MMTAIGPPPSNHGGPWLLHLTARRHCCDGSMTQGASIVRRCAGGEIRVNERSMKHRPATSLAVVAFLALARPALAHTGEAAVVGLQSGFLHPLTGLDHLVAM